MQLEKAVTRAAKENVHLRQQLAGLRDKARDEAAEAARERAAEKRRVAELEERLGEMEVYAQVRREAGAARHVDDERNRTARSPRRPFAEPIGVSTKVRPHVRKR